MGSLTLRGKALALTCAAAGAAALLLVWSRAAPVPPPRPPPATASGEPERERAPPLEAAAGRPDPAAVGLAASGYLDAIDRRMASLKPGDDAGIEQLELEFEADRSVPRQAKLAHLLTRLHGPDATIAVWLLRALDPVEVLGELARAHRGMGDESAREALYGLLASYASGDRARLERVPAPDRAALEAFFRGSTLSDRGDRALVSLDTYGRLASGIEVADAIAQLTVLWREAKASGQPDPPLTSPDALVGQALAALARDPGSEADLLSALRPVLASASDEEPGALVRTLRESLTVAGLPEATRSECQRFLESARPAPSASDDYIRWLEAVVAVQPGAQGSISDSEALLGRLRREEDPVNVASALVHADAALLARLAPADLESYRAALERRQASEVDPGQSELWLLALQRLALASKMAAR